MKKTRCKICNKEINDKMPHVYYDMHTGFILCSKECMFEWFLKEEYIVQIDADNIEQIDDCRFFYNGELYESSLASVCCEKCDKGNLIFSKLIEDSNCKSELYKCNECGYEEVIKCN